MTTLINDTHDPHVRSWVPSANDADTDFPLQNLPYCVFLAPGAHQPSIGVGIGDLILDLSKVAQAGILKFDLATLNAFMQPTLNLVMELDAAIVSKTRGALFTLLRSDCPAHVRDELTPYMAVAQECTLLLPAQIGDYTDFLTSAWHTERHGRFKGLLDPMPAAFYALPIAYHGRASSITTSGTPVRRPNGQFKGSDGTLRFGPSQAMDFELEMAAFVARGNHLGQPVSLHAAGDHLFGYTLLNDWSAKDIQWWEQVLGPFLGKSFMSSLSPWIVTAEALAPFRGPMAPRPDHVPSVMQHLAGMNEILDVTMQAWLSTERMQRENVPAVLISSTNPRNLTWNFEQMLTHHTSNGCNLRAGDLLGSGTVSGEASSAMGCLTEMTAAGKQALQLPNGEHRYWLQDGDEVRLAARASRPGFVSIGFGECTGKIVAALADIR
jgi:fumarylacetoacetase